MMRIAIWHNLISGGGKRALTYHVKALAARGHHIEIWSPDTAADSLHHLPAGVKTHVLPLREELDKIKHTFRYYNSFRHVNKRNAAIKKHCLMCATQINTGGFDVVLVNSCAINYMSFLGKYLKLPSALYLGEPYRWNHEALPDLVWAAPGNRFSFTFFKNHIQLIANRIQVFEEINAAKSYSKILVNSLYSRESVLRAYGIDSEVCYLGIDTSFLSHELQQKKNYVIGLGFFYYPKGVDRAIKTISKIPLHKRPKFIWIGNGADRSYKKQMEELALKEGVELEIKFRISDHELHMLVGQAAVMIYMPRLEPFGFAPLEANALGTAVVSIAEAGVRETVVHGQNGFAVSNEDLTSAAVFIEKFISDLDFAASFGEKCRTYAKLYWSFERLSSNIEQSLKRIYKEEE